MSDFNIAIETVLANEGGYVDDPEDKGKATNFGISQASYPKLDIKDLTRDGAIAIYKRDFWKFENIIDQQVATKVFDAFVNMGRYAIIILQRLVLKATTPDGDFGPETSDAVNRTDANGLLTQYRSALAQHYEDIVAKNPQDEKFLEGWLRRAKQ